MNRAYCSNSRSRRSLALGVALCGALLTACEETRKISPLPPSVSEESRARMARPVNCATARADIATLERERASVERRALAGVRSVMPISAAVGMLSGDYASGVRVATGQYNVDLSAKIAEIKATCNID